MAVFRTPWSTIPCFQLLKNCSGEAVFFIRLVRKIAKRDYEVRHVCVYLSVCLSVRMEKLRCH